MTNEYEEKFLTTSKSYDSLLESEKNMNNNASTPIRLYKKRFFVLFVYCLGMFLNAFAFVQYSVIADVMTKYYNVSNMHINFTSIVYTIGFIVAMLPAIWIFENKGLKMGLVAGLSGNALGFCIKCVGLSPDFFWVTMVGQGVLALSQSFFLTISPHVASVWFGADEVSRATAAGVFCNSIGVAVCGVISPLIVNGNDFKTLQLQLSYMMYVETGIAIITAFVAMFYIPNKPEIPPSLAQAQIIRNLNHEKPAIIKNIVTVIKKRNFFLIATAFSINYAVMFVLSTVFNQMILKLYPGSNQDVGNMVLTLQLTAVLGTIFAGVLLDKTHKYKEISIGVYSMGLLCVGAFTGIIYTSIVYIYVIVALIGFFVGGFITVGLDLGVEMSYPISEVSSLGVAGMFGNLITLILMFGCGWVLDTYGELPTNLILVVASVIGFLLLSFAKIDLNRLTASHPVASTMEQK